MGGRSEKVVLTWMVLANYLLGFWMDGAALVCTTLTVDSFRLGNACWIDLGCCANLGISTGLLRGRTNVVGWALCCNVGTSVGWVCRIMFWICFWFAVAW